MDLYFSCSAASSSQQRSPPAPQLWTCTSPALLPVHLSKGRLQLLSDGLVLLLLCCQFISAKVASSSSVMDLYFSCSAASSSSSLSTSFWSFWTDLSANSALASACFSLAVRVLICSL